MLLLQILKCVMAELDGSRLVEKVHPTIDCDGFNATKVCATPIAAASPTQPLPLQLPHSFTQPPPLQLPHSLTQPFPLQLPHSLTQPPLLQLPHSLSHSHCRPLASFDPSNSKGDRLVNMASNTSFAGSKLHTAPHSHTGSTQHQLSTPPPTVHHG